MIREAIRYGLDPVIAIQMATINPAEYFGLDHVGAIAPGRFADLVVFSDLAALTIEQVYCRGRLTAEHGRMLPQIARPMTLTAPPSMNLDTAQLNFSIRTDAKRMRVIEIIPGQIITRQCITEVAAASGLAVSDTGRDILKIAVVERHSGSGNMGKGFVKGLGLKQGAVASSVAHDSHNIVIAGTNDDDMKTAAASLVEMGGGLAVVRAGKVLAALALPIAGLMSYESVYSLRDQLNKLLHATKALGSQLTDPFMTLSFLALPVIPELKITDKGLVDVKQFKIVSLFVD
jgi:adenine deaminase